MLHVATTANAPAAAVRSQDELDADYPKEAAKDRRDQRRAMEVPGLTVGVRDAVLAALVAYDAAEALFAVYRPLDAQHAADREARPALELRRDRAEARWQKARDAALKAAEKVLTVPTAPGAETAAKFQAFMLLTYVPNTSPRHRKTFTIERAVECMFEEDAKRVLVQALKTISTAPRPEEAVQVVGATIAGHIDAYKAALTAEAGADGTPEYEALYGDSMAAEQALLAAEPLTLAELNAKAKAFTNPDGSVDDIGDSAQAARVIAALARDIARLASPVSAPTIPSDRATLNEIADFLTEVEITQTEEWCQRSAKLLRQLATATPPDVTASDAELLAFDAERARLWDESEKQNTDEAADALYDQSNAFEDRIRRAACATPVAAYLKLDIAKRDVENEFIVPGPRAAELIGQVMAYLRGVPVLPLPSTPDVGLSAVHRELNDLIPRFEEEENLPFGGPSWARKLELERIASLSKAVSPSDAALQAAMIIAIADVACEDDDPDHNKRDRALLQGLATGVLHFLTGATTQHDPALRYYSWPLFEEHLAQIEGRKFDPQDRAEQPGAAAHLIAAE